MILVGFWSTKSSKKAQVSSVSVSQKADSLESVSNNEGEVEVRVTPESLSEELGFWDFDVVLETHSVELSYNLDKISFLVDGAGKTFRAVSWEGDPPGGHHRTGMLRFERLSPRPKIVKLKMEGVGGVSQRVFSWEL